MLDMISNFLTTVDDFVWGIPLIVLILATGLFLTASRHSEYFVAVPTSAAIHIQNKAPGPPATIAVATPTAQATASRSITSRKA